MECPDLSDSRSAAGSVFYSRRMSGKYDLGASYRYQTFESGESGAQSNINTHTQTQTIFAFFSIHLKPTLSVSFSGGPQHSVSTQGLLPATASWSPLTMASMSWQGGRTSLSASYGRIVTNAGGLNGAYHSNSASLSARWQMARTWSAGVSASYALYKTLTPFYILASTGGHTISGTVSIDHPMGEHLTTHFGYSWAQQDYSETATASNFPDVNRVFVSISYQFTRPLQ